MRHVFVETNWVFAYAAPAHHKRLDAVELLKRASSNEVRIHLPALCSNEGRLAILRKCQPRNEADAIRQFLLRARSEKAIPPDEESIVRQVLDRFEQQVRAELRQLDTVLKSIRREPGLELFPLKEQMLERALELSQMDLSLKPFDQAILAGTLGVQLSCESRGRRSCAFALQTPIYNLGTNAEMPNNLSRRYLTKRSSGCTATSA